MALASLFEDLLDQYKIEQHIAEKRYTDLYQAYDVDDDRLVRLDVLRDDYLDDSAFAGRFVNRARALAQVRHPNIAQVLHIGKSESGAPYVAQSDVDGYPLSHRLEQLAQRNTPANAIYALKLIRQLADALLLAERLEIFHHDLQPDNILLKNVTLPTDETVVLIDLFIPMARNGRASGATNGNAQGRYLSPEQRSGKEITAAGHIYSMGVMLFHLLAGRMPEHSITLHSTAFERAFSRPTVLERERPGLAPQVYQLVDRSLRRDPRGRYLTIESFIAALDAALGAEELRLGARSNVATAKRWPPAWLIPLLIVALLLAIGAVAGRGLLGQDVGADRATQTSPVILAAYPVETPTLATAASPEAADPTLEPSPAGMVESMPTEDMPAASAPTEVIASPTSEPSATASPTAEPTATLTPAPEVPRVRVMHNMVNLRRGPGVVYPLLGSVAGGELLEVFAWNNDSQNPWYLVITGDQRIGWIAATVVEPENPDALVEVPVAATLPPTPAPSPTHTATPTAPVVLTLPPTPDPGDLGGGGDDGGTPTQPPQQPTDSPTQPSVEPTATQPPFPTNSP